jgi:1,2-diacylglycerol 3-alpha-glucosyltransferase
VTPRTPRACAARGSRRSWAGWGWAIDRPVRDAGRVRIGMFSDSYLPRISGVVRSVESFVTELRRQGHIAAVYAPGYEGYADADPDVVRFPSVRAPGVPDFPLAIPFARRFVPDIQHRGLDVVHTHSPFLMGAAGHYAARRLRLPLVFTHHTMYSEYVHYVPLVSHGFSREVVTRYTVRYCNRCALVIAPSEVVRGHLVSAGVGARVEVLPTAGLELARYARLDPAWVRPRYGIPARAPLVITVGRLAREKRFDVLLEAFAAAARAGPPRLLVVGGGPQEGELRQIAGALEIAGQVVFSGPLAHDRVLDCYAAADLFAFASPTETQGLVVVEAMAAGLPVVAVGQGGVAEVVRNGETGLLVEAEAGRLGAAIRRLLDDAVLRRRCAAAAREAARAYAIDEIVHRLVSLYRHVSTDAPTIAAPE